MKDSHIAGVDIGGSHITAALVDVRTRKIVEESYIRQPVDASESAESVIAAWGAVMAQAMQAREGVTKIGIAMPGPFDYENGISLIKGQDKYEQLYGKNVKELLAHHLGVDTRNVHMMNDAGCFLQGEVFGGAAQGVQSAVGITLGTGLGSARYENGLASDADLWCMPFGTSIAEDYLSTRWFVKQYNERSGDTISNVKELVGDDKAGNVREEIFGIFGSHLAEFCCRFIEKGTKPDVIVLGGNIALAAGLFMPSLTRGLVEKGLPIPVKLAVLGESAPIFGAAGYWLEAMNRKKIMSS